MKKKENREIVFEGWGLEKNVREVCSAGKSQWIFQRKDTYTKKNERKKLKNLYYSLLIKIIVELNSIYEIETVVIEIGFCVSFII